MPIDVICLREMPINTISMFLREMQINNLIRLCAFCQFLREL